MKKLTSWDNSPDYADFLEAHKEEILRSALDAINPDTARLDRDNMLTLAGAMKNLGYSKEDFAEICARSSADKGTFAKQWASFKGKGRHGEATEATIFDYALRSGWKWPTPEDMPPRSAAPAPKTKQPALMAKYTDDFKIICIMDSQDYISKPTPTDAKEIRGREKIPTPPPVPMTPADFATAVTHGRTFSPTVYSKELDYIDEKGKKHFKYRTIEQQLFVVDIDNEEDFIDDAGEHQKRCIQRPLTIDHALRICEENEIQPFMVYETFSSKMHREDQEAPYTKFRLCFATDTPLTVQEYGEVGLTKVINHFIGLFGQAADKKTTDPARLIYGTDEKDRAKLYKHVISTRKLKEKLFADIEAPTPDADAEIVKSAAEYMDSFKQKIKDSASTPAITTGFNNLDSLLDGGLYAGLYIVGAISSLGKTSFALQLIDQIAQAGQDCLIFSLEMAREELIAKSISRLTYRKAQKSNHAKTTRGILAGAKYKDYTPQERELITEAENAYFSYAEHIYIHEGIGNIGVTEIAETVKKHIQITGNTPVVLIDYLQILAPVDMRATEKQCTDKNVLELKRLSRDYKIPIIGISSFNRDNYSAPVNMAAFKESGAIEYSADVLIGLQYKGMDYQEDETEGKRAARFRTIMRRCEEKAANGKPQAVELKVLKNRNGRRGNTNFSFYAMFNDFREGIPLEEVPLPPRKKVGKDSKDYSEIFTSIRPD